MSSHYDLKKKSFMKNYFSETCAMIWISLIKSIKNRNFKSYLFVYRLALPSFFIDTVSIIFMILGFKKYILTILLMQILELAFCLKIKRKGYFIIWKC